MIVIADTAPINYLVLIGEDALLSKLYGEVVVPSAVLRELLAERSPAPVQQWAKTLPAWTRIESADPDVLSETAVFLDAGEREAIALTRLLQADLLIMDERLGRREAERLNLAYTGTLGVLLAASRRGFVDLRDALDRLRNTSFFISPRVLARLMSEAGLE